MKKLCCSIFLFLSTFYLHAQQIAFKKIDSVDKKLYSPFFNAIYPYDSLWAVETGSNKGNGNIGFIKFYKGQISSGCFISGTVVNGYLGSRGINIAYPFLLYMDTLSKANRKTKYDGIIKSFTAFKNKAVLPDSCIQVQHNIDDAPVTSFLKINSNICLMLSCYALDEMLAHCQGNKKLGSLLSIKQAMEYIKESTRPEEKLRLLFMKLSKQHN